MIPYVVAITLGLAALTAIWHPDTGRRRAARQVMESIEQLLVMLWRGRR